MMQIWGIWLPDVNSWLEDGNTLIVVSFMTQAHAAATVHNGKVWNEDFIGEARMIGDDGLPVPMDEFVAADTYWDNT